MLGIAARDSTLANAPMRVSRAIWIVKEFQEAIIVFPEHSGEREREREIVSPSRMKSSSFS
jgi:hypothetical protein